MNQKLSGKPGAVHSAPGPGHGPAEQIVQIGHPHLSRAQIADLIPMRPARFDRGLWSLQTIGPGMSRRDKTPIDPAEPASRPGSPDDKCLAGNRQAVQHSAQQDAPARDLFHHFIRALARDAARRDHAADPG
ncbi:hypothetical protein [Paracoccus yeei]|uniref:hypothetical protein n=1 Tax=Paracoccus yeei TaxID=147645 RepID=UPI001C8DDD7C|nr:hypothetical protein [Paracoccus yeei]